VVTRADLGPKQAPGPIDIPIPKNCPVLKNPKAISNSFLSPRSAFTPVPPSAKQFLNQNATTPAGESAPNFSGAKNSFTVNKKDSELNLAELLGKSSVAESHVQDTQEVTRQADFKGWQASSTLGLQR
jgi:hypothetical protein